jgi:ribonuclease HII
MSMLPENKASMTKGQIEFEFFSQNKMIVGVDEVGRGCLAGPVFAACASIDYNKLKKLSSKEIDLIRDSKKLSAKQRAAITPVLNEICIEYAIEKADVCEIEKYGILNATFLAMQRALGRCSRKFDILLTDGNKLIPNYRGQQKAIVAGDSLCYCIAAASILAKQKRDLYMTEQAAIYPHYGFESHVGYGTKKHLDAITSHGICPLHRRNFAPISSLV